MTMKLKYDYESAHALILDGSKIADAARKFGIPNSALYSWLRTHNKRPAVRLRRKRTQGVQHATLTVPTELTSLTASAVSVVILRGTTEGILQALRGMQL